MGKGHHLFTTNEPKTSRTRVKYQPKSSRFFKLNASSTKSLLSSMAHPRFEPWVMAPVGMGSLRLLASVGATSCSMSLNVCSWLGPGLVRQRGKSLGERGSGKCWEHMSLTHYSVLPYLELRFGILFPFIPYSTLK